MIGRKRRIRQIRVRVEIRRGLNRNDIGLWVNGHWVGAKWVWAWVLGLWVIG